MNDAPGWLAGWLADWPTGCTDATAYALYALLKRPVPLLQSFFFFFFLFFWVLSFWFLVFGFYRQDGRRG